MHSTNRHLPLPLHAVSVCCSDAVMLINGAAQPQPFDDDTDVTVALQSATADITDCYRSISTCLTSTKLRHVLGLNLRTIAANSPATGQNGT